MEFDSTLQKANMAFKQGRHRGVAEAAIEIKKSLPLTEDELRKFVYYTFLNSTTIDDLKDDSYVGLLVNIEPPLDLSWAIQLLQLMGLEQYIMELLTFGPSGLVYPILDSMRQRLNKNVSVIISLFRKIVTSQSPTVRLVKCFEFETNTFIDCIMTSLNNGKIELAGSDLYALLRITNSCLSFDTSDCELSHFYALDSEYDSSESCSTEKTTLKYQLIDIILKSLEAVFKTLTCSAWISLTEMKTPNNPDISLQRAIGNEVYVLLDSLADVKCNRIQIIQFSMIASCFKMKPITEDDIIAQSSIDDIVDVILGFGEGKDLKKWYAALENANEVFQDPTKTEVLLYYKHLSACTTKILDRCCEYLLNKYDPDSNDFDSDLLYHYVDCLKEESTDYQLHAMKMIYDKNPKIFLTTEHEGEIVEIFNKISRDTPGGDVLYWLVLHTIQNPYSVVSKVFNFALTSEENKNVAFSFLYAIQPALHLKCFLFECAIVEENLLSHILKDILINDDIHKLWQQNFISFMCDDRMTKLLPEEFAREILLPALNTFIDDKNWMQVEYLVKLLSSCWKDSDVDLILFSGYLSHALARTIWGIETFSAQKSAVNALLIGVLKEVMTSLDLKENETRGGTFTAVYGTAIEIWRVLWNKKEYEWLICTILRQPCEVWTHYTNILFDIIRSNFDNMNLKVKLLIFCRSEDEEILKRIEALNLDETQLSIIFFKILPLINGSEWNQMADLCRLLYKGKENSQFIHLRIFSNVLVALAKICDTSMRLCFENCLNIFAGVVEEYCKENTADTTIAETVIMLFMRPFNVISVADIRDRLYLIFLPIFVKILLLLSPDSQSLDDYFISQAEPRWRDELSKCLERARTLPDV